MAVQFNLLPDIKLQADRSRRVKDLVYSGAIAVSVVCLALFLLMLVGVDVVQKKQFNNAGKSLDSTNSQLKNVSNIAQIVTIDNQLQTLVGLHQGKHVMSRIFTYLPQLTPSSVSIGRVSFDTSSNSMEITGNADSQATVNTFIDTLKNATFKVGDSSQSPAFSSVVESGFAINPGNVSYTLDMQFDPKLFANNLLDANGKPQTPTLSVPKSSSTKSDDQIFQTQTGSGG